MSNIDKRALREAAEKATKGQWAVEFDDEIYSTDGVNHEQIAIVFSENEASDAAFIATANPDTVLALLDELGVATDACNGWQRKFAEADERLEAAEKRIAELEAREIVLPPYSFFDFKQGAPFKSGAYCHLDTLVKELAAAGITVKGDSE